VSKAKEAADNINRELKELQVTLTNIDTARPIDQLTAGFIALVICVD
jgi:hypothetical protein